MPRRPLKEKREEMIDFLLENTACKILNGRRMIKRVGNDVVFTDKNGVEYYVKTLSRQADFPYEFTRKPGDRDEDRRRLLTAHRAVADFIDKRNETGLIPGFVLLRAETDYDEVGARVRFRRAGISNYRQLDQVDYFANFGHFLKQKLPCRDELVPHNHTKVLDPLEFVLKEFYRNNNVNEERERNSREGNVYHPGLLYFNPKTGELEEVIFSDVDDPRRFIGLDCPACGEGDNVSHKGCKRTRVYREHAQKRSRARYEKKVWAPRKRAEEVRFQHAVVKPNGLPLPADDLTIAVLEYRK